MDSGLGSDEDRRSRTKEQKQLRNQQLLSGCFIDAASLSDEIEVDDQRRNDERRQGALIFQSSIPQFSMLQMSESGCEDEGACSSDATFGFPETSTPYNSIVHISSEENDTNVKSPLGFYVDLSEVPDCPKTPPSNSVKKNIFSMVIDFEGPKKEKPVKLSSSFVAARKTKSGLNGSLEVKSSQETVCSVNLRPSTSGNEEKVCNEPKEEIVLSRGMSVNSDESLKNNDQEKIHDFDEEKEVESSGKSENNSLIDNDLQSIQDATERESGKDRPQFVKLSDLECQKPRLEISFTPRMSRSIPESSWVECPMLMSRSAGYRSAPHPIDLDNDNESSEISSFSTVTSQPKKAVQRLGTDLLRMFLEEIGTDVAIEVDNRKLKAHKCILASRCQYFAALLSGNWLEDSGNVISLKGFSYDSVYFAMCHIYSGAAYVPDSISLVELASLSDMLGLEGLKEVVEHALKQRHCHNFHKPCAGCCSGVLETVLLSAAYGLDDLYQKCLQWISQNFVKIWPSRAFATLPRELREKCYQQHVVHMTPDRVLDTLANCEKILKALPEDVRWTETVQLLTTQLIDACHLYHRQHFSEVLSSPSFLSFDYAQLSVAGYTLSQVEKEMIYVGKNLSIEQTCRSYSKVWRLLEQHRWSEQFEKLLNRVKHELEQSLMAQSDRLIRSNAWLRLDTVMRTRIKELTPLREPGSRLPRALPTKTKKLNSPNSNKPNLNLPVSSSDSSRNSSPGMYQNRLINSGGSPSLRRSLLLAAKAPQIPPSPTIQRKSTLTQATQASTAKLASNPSKHLKTVQKPTVPKNTPARPLTQTLAQPRGINKSASAAKLANRPSSRSQSPMKLDSASSSPRKYDSLAGSPVKSETSPLKPDSRSSSPRKSHIDRLATPKRDFSLDTKKPSPQTSAGRLASNRKPTINKTKTVEKSFSGSSLPGRTPKKPSIGRPPSQFNKDVVKEKFDKTFTKIGDETFTKTGSKTFTKTCDTFTKIGRDTFTKTGSVTFSKTGGEVVTKTEDETFERNGNEMFTKTGGEKFEILSLPDLNSDDAEISMASSNNAQSVEQARAEVKKTPVMQRSGTFLKDEPTVLGKLIS